MLIKLNSEAVPEFKLYLDRLFAFVIGAHAFSFSDQGLLVQTIDDSAAMLFQLELFGKAFQKLDVDDEGSSVKFDLKDLKDIIAKAKDSDSVSIKYSGGERAVVTLKSKDSSRERVYRLRLQDGQTGDVPREQVIELASRAVETEMDCSIKFNDGGFTTILDDLHVGDDEKKYINFDTLDAKTIDFSLLTGVESSVAANVKVSTEKGKESEIASITHNGSSESIRSTYDMEYLEKLTKLDTNARDVDIDYNNTGSLRAQFSSEWGSFTYIMSPMRETKEEEDSEEE